MGGSTKKESLLFFSPTIRPKIDPRDPSRSKSRLEPTLQPDNTRDDKSITNELKSSRLLEKYSSARQEENNQEATRWSASRRQHRHIQELWWWKVKPGRLRKTNSGCFHSYRNICEINDLY